LTFGVRPVIERLLSAEQHPTLPRG
jgi:hypothetical protein